MALASDVSILLSALQNSPATPLCALPSRAAAGLPAAADLHAWKLYVDGISHRQSRWLARRNQGMPRRVKNSSGAIGGNLAETFTKGREPALLVGGTISWTECPGEIKKQEALKHRSQPSPSPFLSITRSAALLHRDKQKLLKS